MRRISRAVSLTAAALFALAAPVMAQPTQTARGSVTAVTADTLTISAGAQPMTFAIDAKTVVVATGASTASRAAAAEGKPGPKFAELIKVGDAVEVSYHDMGGKLHAANVRRTRSPGAGGGGVVAKKESSEVATGNVEEVTASSLTISGGAGGGANFKQTFTIDGSTKVVGKGAGTAARAGKVSAPDLIARGDRVSVTYHTVGQTLHAAEIRVTTKAP
jgi:hypothetical protein